MHFQEKNDLEGLLDIARSQLHQKLPFVLYRMPNERRVKGIFQNDDSAVTSTSFTESGFVFAPFSHQHMTLWLRPDSCFCSEQPKDQLQMDPKQQWVGDGKSHKALVQKGISAIDKGVVKKVVLSKAINVTARVEPTLLFSRAMAMYGTAFCYLWFHPQTGIWLGASPEQLAKTENGIFHTTALAGTLPKIQGETPQWTSKEYEEQEMVTQYLTEQLHKYLGEIKVDPRTSSLAGTLWHLKTNVSGRLQKAIALKEVIDSIHPTSAVCGLPKNAAMNFILENEGYDRAYYTGYLGEVMQETKEASIFVNLRCLQIFSNEVRIYVGGGITKDSEPEKEWEELLNKSGTMMALL